MADRAENRESSQQNEFKSIEEAKSAVVSKRDSILRLNPELRGTIGGLCLKPARVQVFSHQTIMNQMS
jgi:hypothetical protein